MTYGTAVRLADLIGLTLVSAVVDEKKDTLTLTTSEGRVFKQYHVSDCCESVTIEDVCGNLDDLIGSPLTRADCVTADVRPADLPAPEYKPDSQTWTFYTFATVKGFVTIRWFGESNGYYSESVDFIETTPAMAAAA